MPTNTDMKFIASTLLFIALSLNAFAQIASIHVSPSYEHGGAEWLASSITIKRVPGKDEWSAERKIAGTELPKDAQAAFTALALAMAQDGLSSGFVIKRIIVEPEQDYVEYTENIVDGTDGEPATITRTETVRRKVWTFYLQEQRPDGVKRKRTLSSENMPKELRDIVAKLWEALS